MKIILLHIVILFGLGSTLLQGQLLHYRLQPGETYFLNLKMQQDTKSDNSEMRGNTSLGISSRLVMETEVMNDKGNYELLCSYEKLNLTFFSPRADLTISSTDAAFTSLHALVRKLENRKFRLTLAPTGELLKISPLDSIIDAIVIDTIQNENALLMLRTVKEAFGEDATTSLINTAFNVYDEFSLVRGEKRAMTYFNARMIPILNTFYYQQVKDGNYRVQGIGATDEIRDTISTDNTVFESRLKGNQTFDYLVDKETGWIIEGMSRQKMQTLTTILKHPNLPKGLKIPSYTETEFVFKGGRMDED